MKKDEMLSDLTKQQEDLKKELIEMEKSFNLKKEQFIRIQGAIEALTILDGNKEEEES
mgnify:FL=1|tara:strand:- start:451 stop:624 length:174 start_codon:yes stop_codon:yes gene_type:complete